VAAVGWFHSDKEAEKTQDTGLNSACRHCCERRWFRQCARHVLRGMNVFQGTTNFRSRLAAHVLGAILLAAGVGSSPAYAECVTIKYRDTRVCLNTFTCTDTPQSSFVRTVCYDTAKSYMLIKLNDTWYHYCAVDAASIGKLVHASSVGTQYNQFFRSHDGVHGPFDCRDHPVPSYP